jgi:glyoxylase-like metal-dependent hydrolase (beta-lactamase superfamily II)
VLLTHWHPDHAGSAAEISAWPNVKVWAHRADASIIRGDTYGSFPHLTHAEEGLYAQISSAPSTTTGPKPARPSGGSPT